MRARAMAGSTLTAAVRKYIAKLKFAEFAGNLDAIKCTRVIYDRRAHLRHAGLRRRERNYHGMTNARKRMLCTKILVRDCMHTCTSPHLIYLAIFLSHAFHTFLT